jgi:cyclase
MLLPRVIPCLLLKDAGLVKTVRFRRASYVGDPLNTIKILNDKEVDELVLLDITATPERRGPNLEFLREAVSEAFVPLAYGGGVTTLQQMHDLYKLGVEKVVLNTAAHERPDLVREAAAAFGSQSVVVGIDVRRGIFGGQRVFTHGGRTRVDGDPVAAARRAEDLGAGELLLTAIHRDGTWKGYDLDLIRTVASAVQVPVVACGGAATLSDFRGAVRDAGASAVAAGSMFVYQRRHRAVLVSFPTRAELIATFAPHAEEVRR